jgi:hypothetical protein
VLNHKSELLARECDAIGRSPSEICRLITAPVLVVDGEAERRAVAERLPPHLAATFTICTTADAADALQPYVDAGYGGFTFHNGFFFGANAIGRLKELIALMHGSVDD